jgi:hypothetical protein
MFSELIIKMSWVLHKVYAFAYLDEVRISSENFTFLKAVEAFIDLPD